MIPLPFEVYIMVSKILKQLGIVGLTFVVSASTYLMSRGIRPTIESVKQALRRQGQIV